MPAQQGYDSDLQRRVEAAIARLEQQGRGQMEPLRSGQLTELRFPDQNDPFSYEQYNPNGLTPENQSPLTPLPQPSGGDRTALLEQMQSLPAPPPGLPQARDQFLAGTQGSTGQEGEAPIIPLWLRDQLSAERAMESTDKSIRAQLGAELSRMPPLAPAAPPVEPFTLGEGQTRFSGAGKALASVPSAAPAMTPYQQETLDVRRQAAQRTEGMTPQSAMQARAQVLSEARRRQDDEFEKTLKGETPTPFNEMLDQAAQELTGHGWAELNSFAGLSANEAPVAPQAAKATGQAPTGEVRIRDPKTGRTGTYSGTAVQAAAEGYEVMQ